MTEVERARKAAGSGTRFTIVVVLTIMCCIGLLIWRASFGEQQSTSRKPCRAGETITAMDDPYELASARGIGDDELPKSLVLV